MSPSQAGRCLLSHLGPKARAAQLLNLPGYGQAVPIPAPGEKAAPGGQTLTKCHHCPHLSVCYGKGWATSEGPQQALQLAPHSKVLAGPS